METTQEKDIFAKLKEGQAVNMLDPEYSVAVQHMTKTNKLCFRINQTEPGTADIPLLINEMLEAPLKEGTFIFSPLQIDFGKQMQIGRNVIINHSITCMSAGGIIIDDDVQIGPNVTIVTTNHDFDNHYILRCKSVHIKRNVWIGACVTIMPGITIGENAIIAGGAVVTKNVEPNTIVGGNPAKFIKSVTANIN